MFYWPIPGTFLTECIFIFMMNFTKVIFLASLISTTLAITFTLLTGNRNHGIYWRLGKSSSLSWCLEHIYCARCWQHIVTLQQHIWYIHSCKSHLCIKCAEFFELKLLGARIERLKDQMKLFIHNNFIFHR